MDKYKSGVLPQCGLSTGLTLKSYRSINISLVLLKILERLIGRHIRGGTMKSSSLAYRQYESIFLAGIPGKSIGFALDEVNRLILKVYRRQIDIESESKNAVTNSTKTR